MWHSTFEVDSKTNAKFLQFKIKQKTTQQIFVSGLLEHAVCKSEQEDKEGPREVWVCHMGVDVYVWNERELKL